MYWKKLDGSILFIPGDIWSYISFYTGRCQNILRQMLKDPKPLRKKSVLSPFLHTVSSLDDQSSLACGCTSKCLKLTSLDSRVHLAFGGVQLQKIWTIFDYWLAHSASRKCTFVKNTLMKLLIINWRTKYSWM